MLQIERTIIDELNRMIDREERLALAERVCLRIGPKYQRQVHQVALRDTCETLNRLRDYRRAMLACPEDGTPVH